MVPVREIGVTKMPNVNLPEFVDVFCTKINETFRVSTKHANVVLFMLDYGLKQHLADKHANVRRSDYKSEAEWKSAVKTIATNWVADCNAGTVPTRKADKLSEEEWAMIQAFRAKKSAA